MQMNKIIGILLAASFLMSVTAAAVSAGPIYDNNGRIKDNGHDQIGEKEKARKDKEEKDRKDREEKDRKDKEEKDRKDKEERDRKDKEEKSRKDREDKDRKDKEETSRKDRDDKKRHDDKFKPKGHWKIIKVKHVAWKHGHKFVWFTFKKVFVYNHFPVFHR